MMTCMDALIHAGKFHAWIGEVLDREKALGCDEANLPKYRARIELSYLETVPDMGRC